MNADVLPAEIPLCSQGTPESEHESFRSVETLRFYSMPKIKNFLNYLEDL